MLLNLQQKLSTQGSVLQGVDNVSVKVVIEKALSYMPLLDSEEV